MNGNRSRAAVTSNDVNEVTHYYGVYDDSVTNGPDQNVKRKIYLK